MNTPKAGQDPHHLLLFSILTLTRYGTTSSITVFNLDPDQAWNNKYITPYIVTSVFDEGETVDKLHIELKVTDIDDLLGRNYKAKLERDGKGVFIWMPWVPKLFYHGIGSLYDKNVDLDPQHQAH